MCGRFTITVDSATIQKRFGTALPLPVIQPRFNVSPGQLLTTILNTSPKAITLSRWGYIPQWAKDEADKAIINARAETLTEKYAFKDAFKERRCLIIADGFFEWRQTKNGKLPYYIKLKSEEPFAFAGIYSLNKDVEEKEIPHFAIITIEPNELISPIHSRMPVILDQSKEGEWLRTNKPQELFDLLKPYPASKMKAFPISKLVNSPNNDKPEVIYPLH